MATVTKPSGIDAAWLTQKLRAAGLLHEAAVTGFSQRSIGNGLVGTNIRYELSYDLAEPDAPASVVGKFPSTDETSRQSGASLRLYLRETSFYRYIAPTVRIRTPRVLANQFDADTHEFLLLFEDLAPARAGDQLAGCDAADAHTAMLEIAALHAPRWADPTLGDLPYIGLPPAETAQIAQLIPPVAELFRDRFSAILEPEIMRATMRLAPLAHALMFDKPKQRTVLHGDFRLDNVLFDAKAGAWKLATVDWQTTGRGVGTQDASYFLGAGLRQSERAQHEQELLRAYHEKLKSFGVATYSWEQCWHDYRKHSLNGMFMAMFSAVSVARTDRGDDMFLTMARRHATQALELGAFDLWN